MPENEPKSYRILGIDPGTATTGYGVIDRVGQTPKLVAYGAIRTKPDRPDADRLIEIHEQFVGLLAKYEPDVLVMERLFFSKNQTTAIAVSKSCGVMQFAAAKSGLEVVEYGPMEVKMAVVGYGGADKQQVQYMIQKILALTEKPKPDDAADALALCVCHAHSERLRSLR